MGKAMEKLKRDPGGAEVAVAAPVFDTANRPRTLDDFTGQPAACRQLRIAIVAAMQRGEPLDHVLLSGPPGLGKTTLAQIIADEMGYTFRPTAAPAITKQGEMAALLTSIEEDSVLFIDEIHGLTTKVAEMAYMAMEDHRLDLQIGEGAGVRFVSIPLPRFFLIGATTNPGLLPAPLRARFGIKARLEFYGPDDLAAILARDASHLGITADPDAYRLIARRARGTPRIAKALLRRVRDHAQYHGRAAIDAAAAEAALDAEGIDAQGLDPQDRRYLEIMMKDYGGGPVGVVTLSAALQEDRETLENEIEPFLMAAGLISRTPRGRCLTQRGYAAVERPARAAPAPLGPLFAPA